MALQITNNKLLDTVKSSVDQAQEDLNLPQLSQRGLDAGVNVDTDAVKALVDQIVSKAGDAASDTLSDLGLQDLAPRDVSDVLGITDDVTDTVDGLVSKVGDVADVTLSKLGLSGILKRDPSNVLGVADDVKDAVNKVVSKVDDVVTDTLPQLLPRDASSALTSNGQTGLLQAKRNVKASPARVRRCSVKHWLILSLT